MTGSRAIYAVGLALLASATSAMAQTVIVDEDVPREARVAIEEAISAAETIAVGDTTYVGRGDSVPSDLVQVGGTLILEGRIDGDVTAIDTQVYVRPGASVGGELEVFSGGLYGSTLAKLEGGEVWHREARLTAQVEAGGVTRIVHVPPPRPFPIVARGAFGLVPREYNGVDGLSFQVAVGNAPTTRWPRTRFSGGPLFRTERSDVGWDAEVARVFEDGAEYGVRVYSVTDTHQRWHRGDLVNSLTSFFLADDDRAYFDREGYAVWATIPVSRFVVAGVRWRDDAFSPVRASRPFAVFGDDADWRANPDITRGDGRALGAWTEIDLRDATPLATRGLFARLEIDHWGFGDDFSFDWTQAEVRGYVPVGGGSSISARLVAGGRLGGGETLAPQFLYRLGGRRTVVGYDPLDDRLVGDRMVIAQLRAHVALPVAPRFFERLFVVGLADAGDAWTGEDDRDANVGIGGGLAGAGSKSYMGVFATYGVESEAWQLYALLRPWF